MATDNWYVPEADAAEQSTGDDDATAPPPPPVEADEADTLEQSQELPEGEEYREE